MPHPRAMVLAVLTFGSGTLTATLSGLRTRASRNSEPGGERRGRGVHPSALRGGYFLGASVRTYLTTAWISSGFSLSL